MNNLEGAKSFPKYILLKFPRLNIENDVDNLTAQRELIEKIGKYDSIKKHSKDTLLIKTKSEVQTNKLLDIKQLVGLDVYVTA